MVQYDGIIFHLHEERPAKGQLEPNKIKGQGSTATGLGRQVVGRCLQSFNNSTNLGLAKRN